MICWRKSRQVTCPEGLGLGDISTALYLALIIQVRDPDWLAHNRCSGSWGTSSLSRIMKLWNYTRWLLVNRYVPGPRYSNSRRCRQALVGSKAQSEPAEWGDRQWF